ncbi:polysaccharide biosynthesis/export family protein [uncultured Rhodoblastus sp.]|uniref:polysaccharide biosynthesis/export family protein n=1 Tax=uncultured Rhodoblastus sp. TaxID=543037 RepID=UPI0025CD8911|nr:polysaccharide biosynthesis/export family protein [uncultured Rhodoblastus sp.]
MRNIILPWVVALLCCLWSSAPVLADRGRVVTTNDVLQISVLYQAELNVTTRVEPDGTISLPYAGRVRAAGLTTGALSEKIANILLQKGLVKNPKVSVELATFGLEVSVLGAVGTPGTFTFDRPSTVLQVLARAGGIREEAGAGTIVVHNGGRTVRMNALDLFSGRSSSGLILENNASIYVEPGSVFYLYGYVNRPGQFPINRPHLTVRQALAVGGGVAPLGSDWWRLKIRRINNGVIEEISAGLDDPVLPNDTIIVNERIF